METLTPDYPEEEEFNPGRMLDAVIAGYEREQFEIGDVKDAFAELIAHFSAEELADVQRLIQQRTSILTVIHDAAVTERIKRNGLNQMVFEE